VSTSTKNRTDQLTHPQVFVSDGIVDHYVPSSVKTLDGEELFSVDECIFLLDTYGSDMWVAF